MGLNKPIIITSSAVDTSNLATKSDMTTLQNSVNTSISNMQSSMNTALSGVGGAVKSVQTLDVVANFKTYHKDIVISPVNLAKTFVIESAEYNQSGDTYMAYNSLSEYNMKGYLVNNSTFRAMKAGTNTWEVMRRIFYIVELK